MTRRKRTLAGSGGAVASVAVVCALVLAAGLAQSAVGAANKVNMCHTDKTTGAVSVISVSSNGNAIRAHLNIGDTPQLVNPAGTTFEASANSSDAHRAFDGDSTTTWNSGQFVITVPQWIEITFPSRQTFVGITALVDQTPDGATTHEVKLDGTASFTWSGNTVDNQLLTHTFSGTQTATTIRLTTTVSDSWVSWREITVLAC